MSGYIYDVQVNPSDLAIGRRAEKPMPSREELLARNSFAGPDNNRHLDRTLGIKHNGPRVYTDTTVNKLAEKKVREMRVKK